MALGGWFRGMLARVFGPGNNLQRIDESVAPINKILPDKLFQDFDYPIIYIPGPPNHNARRNRGQNDAALPITQGEYNELINKYNNMVNLPPEVRRNLGETAVKDNPKWVPNENNRPKRDLNPSSSVISSIKLTPDNKIMLRFGSNPREYTYNGGNTLQEAAQAVLDLINSPSIGHAVNARIPGSWGRVHFDQGAGSLPPLAQNMKAGGRTYHKK